MEKHLSRGEVGGLQTIYDVSEFFDSFVFIAQLVVLSTNANEFVMEPMRQKRLQDGEETLINLANDPTSFGQRNMLL